MKIALCISGELRDYYNYIDNIFDTIINKYDTDVFLHTWNHDSDKVKNAINLYKPVKYLAEDFSAEKVIYSKKWLDVNNERIDKTDIKYDLANVGMVGKPQNIFSMYYSIFKSNELKKEYENENNFKYDIVLKFRPDLEFEFEFDFNIDNDILILPYTVCHYGVCDHFAYGTSEMMDKYCDVWLNIEKYIENDDFPKNGPGGGMNPETLLRYHLRNIRFKQIKFKYKLRGGYIY